MKTLKCIGTSKSPAVEFGFDGNLSISGNSYMEDPYDFYMELNDWLKGFLKHNMNEITLNVSLKYVNTTSIKYLFNMISVINSRATTAINIVWEFEAEDEQILEMGEDLQKMTQMNFVFKEISN